MEAWIDMGVDRERWMDGYVDEEEESGCSVIIIIIIIIIVYR